MTQAGRLWRNWAGDQVCVPETLAAPGSRKELADVVGGAAAAGRRVKVVGSGHSFTSVAMTDGVVVDVSALDRVLDVDRPSGLVRVEAGIVLADLNQRLAEHGLALPNLGDIDRQTLAGAISTGTHGTGSGYRAIHDQVEAMELVTGDGSVVEITGGDDLLAARVGLGALGAVATVTLRCVPAFTLHRIDRPVVFEELLERFDELVAGHDHFEFYVFPRGATALTITRDRTDRPPEPRSRAGEFVEEDLQNTVAEGLLRLTRRFPQLIEPLAKVATRILSEGEYVDHSHRVFSSRREFRFTEMEYAIPLHHGPEALERVMALVAEERFDVAMPIECRVLAGDDAFLSPAHRRDTCFIAIHQFEGMPWQPYFSAVEAIMAEYEGRPHWGKRHHLTATDLAALYPRFDEFLALRARLDPASTFTNAYTRQVLGT